MNMEELLPKVAIANSKSCTKGEKLENWANEVLSHEICVGKFNVWATRCHRKWKSWPWSFLTHVILFFPAEITSNTLSSLCRHLIFWFIFINMLIGLFSYCNNFLVLFFLLIVFFFAFSFLANWASNSAIFSINSWFSSSNTATFLARTIPIRVNKRGKDEWG